MEKRTGRRYIKTISVGINNTSGFCAANSIEILKLEYITAITYFIPLHVP